MLKTVPSANSTNTLCHRAQSELDKQKQEAEKLANRLTVLEKEKQELKSNITTGQKECDELKKEHQTLLDWKKEKESLINDTEETQKDLNDKIVTLEKSLISVNEVTDQMKVRCKLYSQSLNDPAVDNTRRCISGFLYLIFQLFISILLFSLDAACERRGRQGPFGCSH